MKTYLKSFIKKNKYLLVIILLSILPTIPYFITSNLIHTHDGLVHLPRLAAYYHALTEGSIPVRFAGYINYGYGLPLFNFIYQFPYWVGSLLLSVGFGLVAAFKISITLSFLLSGIFMFMFGKEFFKDDRQALLVAVLYQFAPFRMVELLVRGSYGEVYTYAFLPLVLYGLVILSKNRTLKGFLVTSLAVFCLIVSHNSVSLMFFGAAFLFVIFTFNNVKKGLFAFLSMFLGLGLAAFYWMPALLEHKYTFGDLFMSKLYESYFPSFQNFFIPNFNNNPSLQTTGITTYIGLIQGIVLICGLFVLLFKRKKLKEYARIFYFGYALVAISFFFMSPVSKFIWSAPIGAMLRQFQFPWRFLALIVLSTSLLSVGLTTVSKRLLDNRVYISIILLTVLSVAFYWKGSLGFDKINEKYYWNFPLTSTYYGETDVIWSEGPAKSYPKQRVEFTSGKGTITNFVKRNTYQSFDALALTDSEMVSHTQYFPGWTVRIDGVKTPIQFQSANHRGEILFNIPQGNHKVVLRFEESKIRLAADFITLCSFITFFVLVFLRKRIFR